MVDQRAGRAVPQRHDRRAAIGLALEHAGAGFAHRFDQAGTYPYFCARHRFMRGHVRVIPHSNGAR